MWDFRPCVPNEAKVILHTANHGHTPGFKYAHLSSRQQSCPWIVDRISASQRFCLNMSFLKAYNVLGLLIVLVRLKDFV